MRTYEHAIETRSGAIVDLDFLDPDSFKIEDIARSLSRLPRFMGNTKYFDSVAAHSLRVFDSISSLPAEDFGGEEEHRKLCRTALLHDASEAYIGDMPTPFKKLMSDYQLIENKVMGVITEKFNLLNPLPEIVKRLDYLDLNWARLTLLPGSTPPWMTPIKDIDGFLLSSYKNPYKNLTGAVELLFLQRYLQVSE